MLFLVFVKPFQLLSAIYSQRESPGSKNVLFTINSFITHYKNSKHLFICTQCFFIITFVAEICPFSLKLLINWRSKRKHCTTVLLEYALDRLAENIYSKNGSELVWRWQSSRIILEAEYENPFKHRSISLNK